MGESDLQRLRDTVDGKAIAANLLEDPRGHFTAAWFRSMEITEAEQTGPASSRITFKFPVMHEYLNPTGSLHGGAVATIFDIALSWLLFLIQKPGFWMTTGLSRTLNVTYLRPAFEGEVVVLECETVHVGKRLALLKGTMKRESDGAAIATCEHNKYNVDADEPRM